MTNLVVEGGRTKFARKSKLMKVTSIVQTIANEEQTNRSLISVLSDYSSQPSMHINQSLDSAFLVHNVQPSSTELLVRSTSGVAIAAGVIFESFD